MKKKVLVTGASGKIGPLLVSELLRLNYRVRLLLRERSSYYCGNSELETVYGDITDFESVLRATDGMDYVFHLAALLHINNPPEAFYPEYYRINVCGTHNIIDASTKSDVERLIIFSTISVYGKCDNCGVVNEFSPVNPDTIYAKTKLLAERMALKNINAPALHGNSDLYEKMDHDLCNQTCPQSGYGDYSCDVIHPRITILRLASVYGSMVTGNYQYLIRAVNAGFFCIPVESPLQSGGAFRTLIHECDAVRCAILAMSEPGAAGKLYNVTDGSTHSIEDIVTAISDALSRKVKIFKIDAQYVKMASDALHNLEKKKIALLSRGISGAASMVDKLMENVAVDGSRAINELGFTPEYDLMRGWRTALAGDISDRR